MWGEFYPFFNIDSGLKDATVTDGVTETNEADATWCHFDREQESNTWRLLFQMGDEFSDWEGMYYTFT